VGSNTYAGHSLHSKEASGLNLCKQYLLPIHYSVDVQQHVLLNEQTTEVHFLPDTLVS